MEAHLAFHFAPEATGGQPLHLHLGVCGSVAAYKALDLVRQWQDCGFSVSVTETPSAQKFVTPLPFEALGAEPVYTSIYQDEHASTPFAHLEPAQTAQAFIIAPATATTMARLAYGLADDLLACQALAFRGPIVLAPAMNPAMWDAPATRANVELLASRGCLIVPPGLGRTACNDMGRGRLADVRLIHLAGLYAALPKDLKGKKALVTLGPTRETWDGVRFWTNASTGTMAAALAIALWLRGADVTAVCGPTSTWLPTETCTNMARFTRIDVTSADEMFEASRDVWNKVDMGVFTAAVADFSPVPLGAEKFKKSAAPDGFDIHFMPNRDILKTLAHDRRADAPQKVMGFAAESSGLEASVRGKLTGKRADMVVGNLLSDGFGTAQNSVFVADRNGREERFTDLPKTDLAWRLTAWLASL